MISLSCTKTELIYFRKKRSANPTTNKINLNGKRLIPTDHIKYLGVCLDETPSGFAHYYISSKSCISQTVCLLEAENTYPLMNRWMHIST